MPSTPIKEERLSTSRILEDDLGQRLLTVRYRVKRNALGRFRNSEKYSGVLHREKTFRDNNIKKERETQRSDGNQQRCRLMPQNKLQRLPVKVDHVVVEVLSEIYRSGLASSDLASSRASRTSSASASVKPMRRREL